MSSERIYIPEVERLSVMIKENPEGTKMWLSKAACWFGNDAGIELAKKFLKESDTKFSTVAK